MSDVDFTVFMVFLKVRADPQRVSHTFLGLGVCFQVKCIRG